MLGEMKVLARVEAASIFFPYLQIDTVDTQKTHKELGASRFEMVGGARKREPTWVVEAK